MAIEYKDFLESLLSKQNLVIRKDGTLNKQEPTIHIGDPESLGIIVFENNPSYKDHHFISGYPISDEAFQVFKETGNIGLSPEERKSNVDMLQKSKRKEKDKKQLQDYFIVIYQNMPALGISNCVKLKLFKISLTRILAFH